MLSEADLEVARKVYVGDIPCELGADVKVTPMKREGMFFVTTKAIASACTRSKAAPAPFAWKTRSAAPCGCSWATSRC